MMEDDFEFEGMDMDGDYVDGYPWGDMSQEDIMEMLEQYDGELTPELLELLEQYRSGGQGLSPEFSRIPVPELIQNCLTPTCMQAVQMLASLLIMCFSFRILCQLCNLGSKEIGTPQWLVHLSSAIFGIMVLHSFFRMSLLYLVVCCTLSYLLLNMVCMWGRQWCGLATAVLIVIFSVSCELLLVEPTTWHKIRGAQIILSMKIISLGVDVGKGSVPDVPNVIEYMGYCFNVGTVVFGPWVSYSQYYQVLDGQSNSMSLLWVLKVLTTLCIAMMCLIYSNCFTHWLILDSAWSWILAYRDAQSFRFSHYFISFLSDATSTLSGINLDQKSSLQWSVTRPQHIEVPRSLSEVVTNWNLPMHTWLKTYVFKPVRSFGIFPAVILTYIASSLLHGLNFQLAAVLLSLGVYSYTEVVFRQRLSEIFDACIQSRKCKEKCDHKYTSRNPVVIAVNLFFGFLAMFHLAYLGLMFDSSDGEDKGYTMWHTLDKWSSLGYLSHWVALGTYVLYWLI